MKKMQVQITKCSNNAYWYRNMINSVFEVEVICSPMQSNEKIKKLFGRIKTYKLIESEARKIDATGVFYIDKKDCKIISQNKI